MTECSCNYSIGSTQSGLKDKFCLKNRNAVGILPASLHVFGDASKRPVNGQNYRYFHRKRFLKSFRCFLWSRSVFVSEVSRRARQTLVFVAWAATPLIRSLCANEISFQLRNLHQHKSKLCSVRASLATCRGLAWKDARYCAWSCLILFRCLYDAALVSLRLRYGGISLSGAKKTRVFFVGNVSCMSLFSAVNVLIPVSLREAPLLLMDLYQ